MINSYQKEQIILDKVKRLGYKPSLLLHSCCGPCSTYPLTLLKDYFDITIFFNNSNIYPETEYNKRLNTLIDYVNIFNKENSTNIKIIEQVYDYEGYKEILYPRRFDKENGCRCKLCYVTRMKEAFEFAKEHNFEYCGTVMSMSRQKDEQAINKIGTVLEKMYDIKFLVANFKKKGGQEIREEIVNKYNMYDQIYCGCEYSIKEK